MRQSRLRFWGSRMTDDFQTNATEQPDLEAIIRDLETEDEGYLPEGAFRAAREHREQIVPLLIELIVKATEEVRRTQKARVKQGHFFALFLLSEFQAKEALPAIVEALSLPGEGPFDLFGDAIHEIVPIILANLAHDQLDLVVSLLRNPDVNEYVHWSAAATLVQMAATGLHSREDMVQILRDELIAAIEQGRPDGLLVTVLVDELHNIYPGEAYEEIKEAYAKGLVDEGIIGLEDVDRQMVQGKSVTIQRLKNSAELMEDSLEELKSWASFMEPEPRPTRPPIQIPRKPQPTVLDKKTEEPEKPKFNPSVERSLSPIVNKQRVGRNDPCPCGSGKKFKKCCGSRR